MVKRGPIFRSAYAAAFLAVALLSVAFIQSTVMQTTGAMPGMTMAICTSHGAATAGAEHGVPKGQSQQTCPYCAAAAHAPLCASTDPIPASVAVAWSAYTALTPLGPRGPPARAPNARGPPPTVLTI